MSVFKHAFVRSSHPGFFIDPPSGSNAWNTNKHSTLNNFMATALKAITGPADFAA